MLNSQLLNPAKDNKIREELSVALGHHTTGTTGHHTTGHHWAQLEYLLAVFRDYAGSSASKLNVLPLCLGVQSSTTASGLPGDVALDFLNQ